MKGYWIEVVNNLIEPKHRRLMRESVWLFMWFLDKITSISEDQIGKVLGGKPITYEEVNNDLDLTERTYRRWISQLAKHKYIIIKRAPNGLIISVNKAKKRFNQKISDVPKVAHLKRSSDVPKVPVGCAKSAGSDVPKVPVAIRQDSRQYNTRQTTSDASVAGKSKLIKSTKDVPKIIHLFEQVNPSCKKFYNNTTQQAACQRLIDLYGFEQIAKVIKILPMTNEMEFAPVITTPYQLEDKYKALEAFCRKKFKKDREKAEEEEAFRQLTSIRHNQ